MPSTEILIAFLLAAGVFAYIPGPSMLYTAAQTLAGGQKAGWSAVLGIHIGGYVHVLAAAFGLAILFQAVPILYAALKILGAGYLVWLGIRMILSRQSDVHTALEVPERNARRAFWQSITVEVLNPKTAIFYLSFLPQFTDPNAALAIWAQLLVLGTIVNVMFSSADVICVVLADRVTAFFKSSRSAGKLTQRLGGGILVALGVNLALSRQ